MCKLNLKITFSNTQFSLTQADGEKSSVAKTEAQKNGKSGVSIEDENLPKMGEIFLGVLF